MAQNISRTKEGSDYLLRLEVSMAYQSRVIANELLTLAEIAGPITHMKLQKLVYISHGWYLVVTHGKPMVSELPEAWQYGPVFPRLYSSFKQYGSKKITDLYRPLVKDSSDPIGWAYGEPPRLPKDQFVEHKVICMVWNSYRKFTGVQLSALTHESGTPWSQTWERSISESVRDMDIPNDLTHRHYEGLASSPNNGDAG
jgi:uncharacterized phage-associated protein